MDELCENRPGRIKKIFFNNMISISWAKFYCLHCLCFATKCKTNIWQKKTCNAQIIHVFFERIIFCALGPQAILEATLKVRDVEGVSQNSAFASKRLTTIDCFGSFMACIAATHSCPNETLDGKDWQNMCFSKVKMAGRISSKMNVTVQK